MDGYKISPHTAFRPRHSMRAPSSTTVHTSKTDNAPVTNHIPEYMIVPGTLSEGLNGWSEALMAVLAV